MIEADLAHIRLLSRVAARESISNEDYERVLKIEADLQTHLILIEGIKKNEGMRAEQC